MMEIRRTDLCDVCRQHFAIHRFNEFDLGHSRDRQVCASCFTGYHATPAAAVFDVNKLLLAQGNCEMCGGRAFAVSGIPGPDRRVLCSECAQEQL